MLQTRSVAIQSDVDPARGRTLLLTGIAFAVFLLHLFTNQRYGFHRDELQFLSDARHLEWGFVAYPPFTPFVERVSLALFGVSLAGLRLFSAIAQSGAIVVSGLMARELGAGRVAQIATALAVALSPLPLFEGTEFQYTTFDYLWWVLIAYFVIRLLKSEDPRWWLAIGATMGVGLMTKYAILFFIACVLAGFLLTPARRLMRSFYFAGAIVLVLLLCSPNLVWQAHHGFISYQFLHSIHVRDVGEGRAKGFVSAQFWLCVNTFAAPLWIIGLISFLRSPRYRVLAWMYLIPLALFFFSKGRGYYLAAAYPMLIAMGAAASERWLVRQRALWRNAVKAIFFAGLVGVGVFFCAIIIPFAGSGRLMRFALSNNGDLREEIGWQELVTQVGAIRDSLSPDQQANLGVLVGNYGEQGAIEILGRPLHLPVPISGTNSAWLRGYPTPPPNTLITLGLSRRYVERTFTGCRLAGHNANSLGVKNEESADHPDIFVCGPPRQTWAEFWQDFQSFG